MSGIASAVFPVVSTGGTSCIGGMRTGTWMCLRAKSEHGAAGMGGLWRRGQLGMRWGGSAGMSESVAAGSCAVYERGMRAMAAMGAMGDEKELRHREYDNTSEYNQYDDINDDPFFGGFGLWQRFH